MASQIFAPRLVLIGNSGVGKTAIGRRFTTDTFDEKHFVTIGPSNMQKTMNDGGNVVDLTIWDTAGQETFRSLTTQFFRDASMAIVVFSVVEEKSFEGAEYWINKVNEIAPSALLVLAGNKIDLSSRIIDSERAAQFAEEWGIPYFETSAVTGQGIQALFEDLIERFIDRQNERAASKVIVEEEFVAPVVLPPIVQKTWTCC
jgi:small GTP-binding protein